MLKYTIHYSKEFKLYDLVIEKKTKYGIEFIEHHHISNKKELIKLINTKN